MIAKHVHHISFAVRDLERSRAFYEGILGLETIERPDFGLPGVWYQAGGSEVHLIQAPEGVDAGRPPAKLSPIANHQAFSIEDYGATLETLRGHGLEVLEAGPERRQMWIADPDGYVIELIAPAART
jgi:glyoxylase I family protein